MLHVVFNSEICYTLFYVNCSSWLLDLKLLQILITKI